MKESHAVVIVGGGPTGLMLAGELALARVDVAIVERRERQELAGTRAGGLHARTIEVLDQRGIADRFLARGQVMQVAAFAGPLDISDAPTRHAYGLALRQNHIERILADWVGELAVPIYRGREATAFAQDDTGVDLALSDGRSLRAQFVVGCDGGRSLIRKHAGIDFVGWEPSTSYLIAEVEMTDEPPWGLHRTEHGTRAFAKVEDGARAGIVLEEAQVGHGDPSLAELRAALVAAYGTDFGVRNATWLSRFSDAARQAPSYRERRVLLAGDAAHVHSPVGGQGLNTGVQDAVNLRWKLAQVVHGTSPERLLDTYQAERHPVGGARAPHHDGVDRAPSWRRAQQGLERVHRRAAANGRAAQAIRRHDVRPRHPLRPRRRPSTARPAHARSRPGHRRRPAPRVHAPPRCAAATDPARGGRRHHTLATASATHPRTLRRRVGAPALGAVAPPTAVLVRPDGHVAWVGEGTDQGLRDALATWFGSPAPGAASAATA